MLGFLVLAIQAGEKYLRVGIISGYFHAGDGHQTHARVVDLETYQLGNFTLDLLCPMVTLMGFVTARFTVRVISSAIILRGWWLGVES